MSKQQNFSQEQTNAYHPPRRRRPGGPMGGRGMMPGEKPKNLKKSLASLMRYMGRYKFGIFAVMIFAACSTVFSVIGPKILGKTTKLASFWVMFAIIVGGGLFGLPGMILGVPVFAVIYAYTSGAINSKLREKEMPTDTLVYEDFSKYRIDKEEVFGKERCEAARRVGEHDTEAARRE